MTLVIHENGDPRVVPDVVEFHCDMLRNNSYVVKYKSKWKGVTGVIGLQTFEHNYVEMPTIEVLPD